MAGIARISIVGLRVGASVAALTAATIRPHRLVLWDPIVDGASELAALAAMTGTLLRDRARFWELPGTPRRPRPDELVGFSFGERLVTDLGGLDLRAWRPPAHVPLCVVRSDDDQARLN